MFHDPQAHAGAGFALRKGAGAVVFCGQAQVRAIGGKLDLEAVGAAVANGVVRGFLRDEVEMMRRLGRGDIERGVARKLARNTEEQLGGEAHREHMKVKLDLKDSVELAARAKA